MIVARVRAIAARVADAGEHASAMKDKVTSESLIDRDSADSADILFYREIYLALGFPMSAVGGVSYGFREVLTQADGRVRVRATQARDAGVGVSTRYGIGTLYGTIPLGILVLKYKTYK